MKETDLTAIHDRMLAAVVQAGGRIDAIYHCPHHVGCRCRKPEIGMFVDAAADLGFELKKTVVVGDQPSDMLAAQRIGAMRIQIGRAGQTGVDHVADDLADAARWLLDRVGSSGS